MTSPSRLLYIYDGQDALLLESLDKHLSSLKAEGMLESWHRQKICPGDVVETQINQELKLADVVAFLVSADLLASKDYLAVIAEARSRPADRSLKLLPILVRAVDWTESELGKLSPLPPDGRPITSWENRDEAWKTVALGIRHIISQIRGQEPKNKVPLFAGRLRWTHRIALVLFVALASGGSVAFWPPLAIVPFPDHQAGVVVAWPWLAGAATKIPAMDICHELEKSAPGGVRCERVSLSLSPSKLQKRAQEAGAVLLVAVDFKAQASVLVIAENRELLLPPEMPISFSLSTPGLANLLHSFREIVSENPRPCQVNLGGVLHGGNEYALLAALTEWHCQSGRPNTGDGTSTVYNGLLMELEKRLCQATSSVKEPRCALARYLAALDCPAGSRAVCKVSISKLSELVRDASSQQLRWRAGLELARRGCRDAPAESAEALLRMFNEATNQCELATLAPVTACTIESPTLPMRLRKVLLGKDQELIQRAKDCPKAFLGAVMAELGTYYLEFGHLSDAEESFAAAVDLEPRPQYMLGQAEALLLQGKTAQVSQAIALGQIRDPSNRSHAAFLIWLAAGAKRDFNARELLGEYESVVEKGVGLFDATGTLKRIADRSLLSRQVYAILVAPQSSHSKDDLNALLNTSETIKVGK